jgi:hypothetical protein
VALSGRYPTRRGHQPAAGRLFPQRRRRDARFISGDNHHYSRCASLDGKQFITSCGGGAFLHPTHQLEPEVEIKWSGKIKLADAVQTLQGKPLNSRNTALRRLSWTSCVLSGFCALPSSVNLLRRCLGSFRLGPRGCKAFPLHTHNSAIAGCQHARS